MLGVALCAGVASGCIERRFVVNSEPSGAAVLRNNVPIGAAPADDHFLYYGKYKFTLVKDGYETLNVEQDVPQPWYEYPPLDFIVETLLPWKIRDTRRFTYQMQPAVLPRSDELLGQADVLRAQGKTLQSKKPPVQPAAPAAPAAPPATPTVPEAPPPRQLPATAPLPPVAESR